MSPENSTNQQRPLIDNLVGNVLIRDSLRVATCGRANYDRSEEVTSLELDPKISENKQVISGEKIILTYKNEILNKEHILIRLIILCDSFKALHA